VRPILEKVRTNCLRLEEEGRYSIDEMMIKKLAKKGRGSSHQIVCNSNKIAIVKWFDNKVVTLASSFVDSHPMVKIKRWLKDTKTKTDVDWHYMGGVDLADMLIALYRSTFKTKRWYMAIFSQVIDISVNNAWLLYRRNLSPNQKQGMTLKKFRFQIIMKLLQKNRVQGCVQEKDIPLKKKITAPTVSRPTDAVIFDKIGHFPVFVQR
ncbi:hypothetical protein HW555_012896, partial [Spodoptera exigua]